MLILKFVMNFSQCLHNKIYYEKIVVSNNFMKKKTETITVAVEMAITYDPTCKGAREEVIKCAVRDLPNDLGGACIHRGCYSVKRGRKYLVPNAQDQP
jgi:hypothetical protein